MSVLALLVLFWGGAIGAQEALTIATPPGKPLVWDPEILIPEHDPETEMVLFRILEAPRTEADVPFFVDRIGVRVLRVDAPVIAETLLAGERVAVLSCSFPGEGSFDLVRPEIRSRYCVIRRTERQP